VGRVSGVARRHDYPRFGRWKCYHPHIGSGAIMREYPEILHGVDKDDNVTDVQTYPDGKLFAKDMTVQEWLELIYLELRKLNVSMSLITDDEIQEGDLDEDY
jgi:hypothetical protein